LEIKIFGRYFTWGKFGPIEGNVSPIEYLHNHHAVGIELEPADMQIPCREQLHHIIIVRKKVLIITFKSIKILKILIIFNFDCFII